MKKNRWIKTIAIIVALAVCYCGFAFLISNQVDLSFSAVAEEVTQTDTGTLNYSDGSLYEGEILYGRIKNGTVTGVGLP